MCSSTRFCFCCCSLKVGAMIVLIGTLMTEVFFIVNLGFWNEVWIALNAHAITSAIVSLLGMYWVIKNSYYMIRYLAFWHWFNTFVTILAMGIIAALLLTGYLKTSLCTIVPEKGVISYDVFYPILDKMKDYPQGQNIARSAFVCRTKARDSNLTGGEWYTYYLIISTGILNALQFVGSLNFWWFYKDMDKHPEYYGVDISRAVNPMRGITRAFGRMGQTVANMRMNMHKQGFYNYARTGMTNMFGRMRSGMTNMMGRVRTGVTRMGWGSGGGMGAYNGGYGDQNAGMNGMGSPEPLMNGPGGYGMMSPPPPPMQMSQPMNPYDQQMGGYNQTAGYNQMGGYNAPPGGYDQNGSQGALNGGGWQGGGYAQPAPQGYSNPMPQGYPQQGYNNPPPPPPPQQYNNGSQGYLAQGYSNAPQQGYPQQGYQQQGYDSYNRY